MAQIPQRFLAGSDFHHGVHGAHGGWPRRGTRRHKKVEQPRSPGTPRFVVVEKKRMMPNRLQVVAHRGGNLVAALAGDRASKLSLVFIKWRGCVKQSSRVFSLDEIDSIETQKAIAIPPVCGIMRRYPSHIHRSIPSTEVRLMKRLPVLGGVSCCRNVACRYVRQRGEPVRDRVCDDWQSGESGGYDWRSEPCWFGSL